MLSFRPKGGISDSANDRDVSTSLRFARHDRTTFILSTYLYRCFEIIIFSPSICLVRMCYIISTVEFFWLPRKFFLLLLFYPAGHRGLFVKSDRLPYGEPYRGDGLKETL